MNLATLKAADQHLRNGSLYKQWAQANKNEATQYTDYVNAVIAGGNPTTPKLVTETGQGFVTYASGYAPDLVKLYINTVGDTVEGEELIASILCLQ